MYKNIQQSVFILALLLLSLDWSQPAGAQNLASCKADPIGAQLLKAAAKLPNDVPQRDWLQYIHLKELSFPNWVPVNPLEHLDAVEASYMENYHWKPDPKLSAQEAWEEDKALVFARIAGTENAKDYSHISADETQVDFGGEVGVVDFIRINYDDPAFQDIGGHDLPLNIISQRHDLFVQSSSNLASVNETLFGILNGGGDWDIVYFDKKPLIVTEYLEDFTLGTIAIDPSEGRPPAYLFSPETCRSPLTKAH